MKPPFSKERSALIDAIKAENADEKLQLTRVAVGLYRARQERFFVDHPDELRLLQDVALAACLASS